MSSLESSAFSSDGAETITRHVTVVPDSPRKSLESLRDYYELERCVEFLTSHPRLQKVALQFPDHLLCDAVGVASLLKAESGRDVFILGDTSYGSCCVDEVAAEHVQADCILHFGPSCLTQTTRLPVLYVFGREEVDSADCARCFRVLYPDQGTRLLVLYDTPYSHCIDGLRSELQKEYPMCVFSSLLFPDPIHPPPADEAPDPSCPPADKGGGGGGTTLNCSSCSCAEGASQPSSTASQPGTTASQPGTTAMDKAVEKTERNESELDESEHRNLDGTAGVLKVISEEKSGDPSSGVNTSSAVSAPTGDSEPEGGVSGSREPDPTGLGEVSKQEHVKHKRFGRQFELAGPVEDYCVFFIGWEGPTLTNILLSYSRSQFHSYNPVTKECRRENANVNKALGRRYYLVQKAKEARTVGILAGTLGVANYLEIIERLKQVLKQAGKKYYTIAVGKLNVAKLANFMEIDVYVLVACPEASLVDPQGLYKPVVTPFEMEIACLRAREWTGELVTDFQECLPGASHHLAVNEAPSGESEEPEFSLLTGSLLPSRQSHEGSEDSGGAVVARGTMDLAIPSAAAEFFQTRSWRGLEQQLGESEVREVEEGDTGLPTSYRHESQFR